MQNSKKKKSQSHEKNSKKKFKGTFHLLTRRPVNEKKSKGLSLGLNFRLLMRKKSKGLSLGKPKYFHRNSVKIIHSLLKSYLTPSITIPPFLIASATLLADIFSFYKASFLVLNSSLSFEDSKPNFLNFLPLEGNPKAFLSSYTKRL